jgi:pyrroline-5-carboxylate reductase
MMVKVGFIGVGNMAKAIIKTMKKSDDFLISGFDIDKNFNNVSNELKIKKYKSNVELVRNNEVVFLSVKPHQVNDILSEIRDCLKNHMIISIAAGISIKKIQTILSKKIPVVRVMPNTPVMAGEGACGYVFSREVTPDMKKNAKNIIKSFCAVSFQVKEKDIDVITSLSGSGPAYFFYVAEAMIDAAKELGFNEKKAEKLIAQTMTGSGKLLLNQNEKPLILRRKVTSKGGTTEAAITVFEKNKLKEIIKDAVFSAYKKAKELGK